MKYSILFFLLLSFLFSQPTAFGQDFFRVQADFSIKEIASDAEKGLLIMGKVYYDKNYGQLIYDIRFPARETWVFKDTSMYQIRNDSLLARKSIVPFTEFSFFKLLLDQQLNDYGLAKGGYKAVKAEQSGDQIITTWIPPERIKEMVGTIQLSMKNALLYGVVVQDTKGNAISKQYFTGYETFENLPFPKKIIQVAQDPDLAIVNKRMLTFKNIKINAVNENHLFTIDFANLKSALAEPVSN